MAKKNLTVKMLIMTLVISFVFSHVYAKETKTVVLDTSIGQFLIEAKVIDETRFSGGIPEYDITITKEGNKINFINDRDYYPGLGQGRNESFTDNEVLTGMFINLFSEAFKAIKNRHDFCNEYTEAYSIIGWLDCGNAYKRCKSSLEKMKILLGNDEKFLTKLEQLYNDGLKIRRESKMFFGLFLK